MCGCDEMTPTLPVIAQDPPLLEPRDHVLDPRATPAMSPPRVVPHDPVATKHGRDELVDASIAAIGEYAAVQAAQTLDETASVVHRIVAIAGASTRDRDDTAVGVTDEDLRLGFRRGAMIAGRHESAVDDPGATAIPVRAVGQRHGQPWAEVGDDPVDL